MSWQLICKNWYSRNTPFWSQEIKLTHWAGLLSSVRAFRDRLADVPKNCFSQSFGRLWLDKLVVRLRQGCFSSKVTFKIFCQQLHQTFRINLFQGTYVCLIMNVSFQDSLVIITGLINQSVSNQHVFGHNACSVSCSIFSMSVIYKSRKMILMLMIFGANNLEIKAFSKSSVWHMIKSSHHTCLLGHLLRKFKRQVT